MRFAAELAELLPGRDASPPHLAGVPPCLHKYEPLFRRATADGRATAASR